MRRRRTTSPRNEPTNHSAEAQVAPMVDPQSPSRFSMKITTWAVLAALVVLGSAAAVFISVTRQASEEALNDAARVAHDNWTSNGRSVEEAQVRSAFDVLESVYVAGNALPQGSPQTIDTLLPALLSNSNDILRFQLVATASADNSYTSVGYSGPAAQIGLGTAANGEMIWRPIQGGTEVTIPGFTPTEREWYQQVILEPGTMQVVGPSIGLDNKLHYTIAVAEPGTSRVWSASVPGDSIARLVRVAWPPDRNHDSAFFLRDKSGEVQVEWSSSRMRADVLADAAKHLEHQDTYTTTFNTDSGPKYLTIGRVFSGIDSAMWATTSSAAPLATVDASGMVLVGVIVAAVALIMTGAGAYALSRSLARARRYVSDGHATTAPTTRVSEVDALAYAAKEQIEKQQQVTDGLAESNSRLEALHQRTITAHSDRLLVIATDLHDGPLQDVVAAGMLLDTDRAATATQLERARDGMRAITVDLLGDESGPGGFADRVAELADEANLDDRFSVTATAPDQVNLPEETSRVLLRAIRELLVNARKHSGSAVAEVVVAATSDTVQVTVADRGVGFSSPQRAAGTVPDNNGGFGLFSIQVEVSQLGGTVTLSENLNGGAVVAISVPISAAG